VSLDVELLLAREWQTLQNCHEDYERSALLIKLVSLALWLGGLAFGVAEVWIALLVALCWLQEGIYKTFQARIGVRLLRIERFIKDDPRQAHAMQLHSEWLSTRKTGSALIVEYVASAFKPTVMFPYVVILGVWGLSTLLA